MCVGILTGVGSRSRALSPGLRDSHRAVPIQPPEAQGGSSRGAHQPWARLSSNMSRRSWLNFVNQSRQGGARRRRKTTGGVRRVQDTGEELAAYNRSPAALTFLSQVNLEIGTCFCTSECSSPVRCSRVQDGAARGVFSFFSPERSGGGGQGESSNCSRTRSARSIQKFE